jgi:hypothetical protein
MEKKKQFPLYNIYFHDDDYAVDTLFYDNGKYWYNIFPQLKRYNVFMCKIW